MPKSDDKKSIQFNACDRAYGSMCRAIPPTMCYLIDVVEFPSEIWSRLEKEFGHKTEYISTKNWESASSISLQDPLASITYREDEVVQDEEEVKYSTQLV